jgi:tetratricopeptide (TPR) repeat protein
MIYDQRIMYYKQKGSFLGRKGVDLMRWRRSETEGLEESYGYLKESITILRNRSSAPIMATFMLACYGLYEKEMITDMQVIEDYSMVSDVIDYQLLKNPDDADLLKVKENVDFNFIASGAPTCESLISFCKQKYPEKKEHVSFLKKAVTFMGTLDCEQDPFYAQVAEELYRKEPSAQSAFSLAALFVTKDDFNKAYKYYKEAIEKEEDPEVKADYYYQLGVITNSKLERSEEAKTYGLEALKLRPNWGEPYILIGDTYIAGKNCFEDDFEKTTIYWAAVDKFIQAKSVDPSVAEKANERISTYSKYFPDVETIFFYSLKEGDQYTVGCWINETTTVRSR